MPEPDIRDVHVRTITTSTVNDTRQYAQSTYDTFSDSDRGHRQGAYGDWQQAAPVGPFEMEATSPEIELQEEIASQVFGEALPIVEPREEGTLYAYEADPYDDGDDDGDDGYDDNV